MDQLGRDHQAWITAHDDEVEVLAHFEELVVLFMCVVDP